MSPESLGTFGEVETDEELADLDLEPIPFTLVGYEVKRSKLDTDGFRLDDQDAEEFDREGHAKREYTFHVRPTQSFGPTFNVLQQADAKGVIPMTAAVQFIGDALVADDREEWFKTIRDPEVEFQAALLGTIAEALSERYGLRPSAPRSERRGGPRRSSPTSTAESSGRATPSRRRTPQTVST
jgi:hypothetical protein